LDDPKTIADIFADVKVLDGSWEGDTSDNDVQDEDISTHSPVDNHSKAPLAEEKKRKQKQALGGITPPS